MLYPKGLHALGGALIVLYVGITGRYIGDYKEDENLKWFPVIPHPKSQTLYGYIENYQYLQGCEELFIGESEKFPMAVR